MALSDETNAKKFGNPLVIYRSSRGGNETAEAFDVEGSARDLANMQAVT
jgi:hypothetical protein